MAHREGIRINEPVWIRAESTHRAAAGVLLEFDVDEANARVALGTDFFDWDNEKKLIEMSGADQWYPTYRLEPIRW